MGISWFLYREDAKKFFRRNLVKFIFAGLIVAIAVIFAVRNAFTVSASDYFEGHSGPLFSFVRGDGSLVALTLVMIAETALLLAFGLVCAYNDFTAPLGLAVLAYVAYFFPFGALIVFRYYSARAIVFFVLYLAATAAMLLLLAGYIVFIMNSQQRYRYGVGELKCLAASCVPLYIAFAVLIVVRVLFVLIGCIFI